MNQILQGPKKLYSGPSKDYASPSPKTIPSHFLLIKLQPKLNSSLCYSLSSEVLKFHDFSPNFALGLEDKQTASPALQNHKRMKSPAALKVFRTNPKPAQIPREILTSGVLHPIDQAALHLNQVITMSPAS